MPQQEAVLRILLVDDRLEDAEHLISTLRNGGIAVRPLRPESEEELIRQLGAHQVDIVLAARNAKYIAFDQVIKAVIATGKDVPVIAILEELSRTTILDAISHGARDQILRNSAEHVQHVVKGEFAAVYSRRAQRQLEATIRETERRCDSLISSSRDPIAYIHEGMHIRTNEAYLEMFGYETFEDVEVLSVLDLVAPDHADRFKQLLKSLSKAEVPPKQFELKAQRADGNVFDATMEFTPATYDGEPCLQLVFRPQLVDAAVAEELEQLRQRDALTGLFNRQHFMGELESAVAAAASGNGQRALLLIEPDNYEKLIGDIGMAQVDELLKGIARRIEGAIGESVQCARLRDHTFAVLCLKHDHNATQHQAEQIRTAFHGHIVNAGDRSVNLNISIGGVQIGERIASVPQVLSKASQCLQSAAGVGGNRIEIFDPAARDRAEEERVQAWIKRIRDAMANDEFTMHYQPIISLQGEPGETYEGYIRLQGSAGETVMPETFMPIARENGLVDDIDRWVIARTIAVIAERMKQGKHTTIFIKLTAETVVNDGTLANYINEQLLGHGVPGDRLVLQLHEPAVFTNLRAIQSFQQAVSKNQVQIALEHFGTGLNSFQLLQHVNPTILKIDRSFVQDLAKNAENQTKVREMADTAREHGKRTVAHYVQDAASMTVLFSIGVDYVEGNFLAPASPQMNYDFG